MIATRYHNLFCHQPTTNLSSDKVLRRFVWLISVLTKIMRAVWPSQQHIIMNLTFKYKVKSGTLSQVNTVSPEMNHQNHNCSSMRAILLCSSTNFIPRSQNLLFAPTLCFISYSLLLACLDLWQYARKII